MMLSDADDIEIKKIGWPCVTEWIDIGAFHKDGTIVYKLVSKSPQPYYSSVVVDIFVAFSILFAVWFLCEWLIRRRAARKGA